MSKRAEIREKRHRQKQRERLTLGFIFLGVVLIIVAIVILPSLQPIGEIVSPPVYERPLVNGNTIGDPNAPVVMEEYSDYQCAYCRLFSEEVEPLLIDQYVSTGQLYIVFKPFPLGPSSVPISEASLCAREQEKFWEYHDIVFANQDSSNPNAFSSRRLEAFAEVIGLDMDAFNQCTKERRYKDEVQQISLEGESLGITGTPTFFINGKLVRGTQPIEVFQQEIEAALAAAVGS